MIMLGAKSGASAATCERFLNPSWKLIRDELPTIFEREGDQTEVQTLHASELESFLWLKLEEEIAELKQNPSHEEMADIQEVLLALQKIHGLDPKTTEKVRLEKHRIKGGFERGYVMKLGSD